MKRNLFIALFLINIFIFGSSYAMQQSEEYANIATLEGIPVEIKETILNYIATGKDIKEVYSNIIKASSINRSWRNFVNNNFVRLSKIIARKFYGNNLNQKDNKGNTPLIRAIKDKNNTAITILIAAGADVNIPNNNYYTALYYAADQENVPVVKLLIVAGAKILRPSEEGWEESILGNMRMRNKSQEIITHLTRGQFHNWQPVKILLF